MTGIPVKKIIINSDQWQTRVAITEDGELKNIYFEPHSQELLERSFFKGVVSKVLPGIQTAFVDIGKERAGFLHISEIDREMALEKISKHAQLEDDEKPQPKPSSYQKPDIAKIIKEGEAILVQVSKEPVYEKGPKLTTCFTLPGRFLVLMPNIARIGISKKIEDRDERIRLKELIKEHLPEGMGTIIRTSAQSAGAKELLKDLAFLVKTWREIEQKYTAAEPEEKIYQDLDLVLQIVRDHLDESVEMVVVDNQQVQSSIYKFIRIIAPEFSHIIKLYAEPNNVFDYYKIETQIQAALERKVALKSGGSLIIETTEAMTVIDVNTGKFIGKSNLEDTILKTNLEAAEEVGRQLRLRNIGGLIVIDFIDMGINANRQTLFKKFEKLLKERDKFQSVVLKISEFGLVQMTRKRSGKTLMQQLMHSCPTCHTLGFIKSIQTRSYELLRQLKTELGSTPDKHITVHLHSDLFNYIGTVEYDAVLSLEKTFKGKITLATDANMAIGSYRISKI